MNNYQENINPLKKANSLHNIDQQEQILFLNKSRSNLTIEQMNIIENFLKVDIFFLLKLCLEHIF